MLILNFVTYRLKIRETTRNLIHKGPSKMKFNRSKRENNSQKPSEKSMETSKTMLKNCKARQWRASRINYKIR